MKTLPLRIVLLVGDIAIFAIHCFLCAFHHQSKIEEHQASILGFCVIGIIILVFLVNIGLMLGSIVYKLYSDRKKKLKEERKRVLRPLYIRRRFPRKSVRRKINKRRSLLMERDSD